MSKRHKIYTWLLITLSYVFSYGSTLVASYHYLAKDLIKESSIKGGGFFFAITGITLITAIVSLTKLINRMKANVFKSIFKGLMKVGIIFIIKFTVTYVSVNFEALSSVLMFTIFGMILGTSVEAYTVHKYGDYVREVGVL